MTYEKYKTVIFRVCVFLTVLIEVWTLLFSRHNGLWGLGGEETVFGTPILIWGTYFFGFWIYEGTLDKEDEE